jgi:hypothetical protein
LVVLAIFLPWLIYAAIRKGRRLRHLLVLSLAVVVALAATVVNLYSYTQRPNLVVGRVTHLDGRNISVASCLTGSQNFPDPPCSTTASHLVVSDAQLRDARRWLKEGTFVWPEGVAVWLWVSPLGHAGFIGRPPDDLRDLR